MRQRVEAEGAAEFDQRHALVGGGHQAAEPGFEEPDFRADEVGGEEGCVGAIG